MNETQAKAAMRKLWGTKAAWRYNERAPKGEEREAIEATLPELRAASDAAKQAREARRAELLADPEYVRLVAEYTAKSKAYDIAASTARARRVTVGYCNNGAGLSWFHVVAEGDNWQDAIDAARAKNGKP